MKTQSKRKQTPAGIKRLVRTATAIACIYSLGATKMNYNHGHKPSAKIAPLRRQLRQGDISVAVPKPAALIKLRQPQLTDMELAMALVQAVNSERLPIRIGKSYAERIVREANWASKELNIPRELVMAQWLMESGKLQNQVALRKNNLGGLMARGSLIGFYDHNNESGLHRFARSYVRTISFMLDGQGDRSTFERFVHAIEQEGYSTTDTERSYKMKLIGMLRLLSQADSHAFGPYYKDAIAQN